MLRCQRPPKRRDGSAFTGEVESTFVAVSETSTTTDTVTGTSVAGFQITVNSHTVQTYKILDDPLGYLEIEKIETHAETSAGGFSTTLDTTLTNSPAQLIGPGTRWCEGDTWTTPVVTQTIEATGMPTTSGPSATHDGIVDSINEIMTTPAGTFTTVKSRRTGITGDETGYVTIAWIDVATSMMVRQEGRDPSGTLIFEYELIDLD